MRPHRRQPAYRSRPPLRPRSTSIPAQSSAIPSPEPACTLGRASSRPADRIPPMGGILLQRTMRWPHYMYCTSPWVATGVTGRPVGPRPAWIFWSNSRVSLLRGTLRFRLAGAPAGARTGPAPAVEGAGPERVATAARSEEAAGRVVCVASARPTPCRGARVDCLSRRPAAIVARSGSAVWAATTSAPTRTLAASNGACQRTWGRLSGKPPGLGAPVEVETLTHRIGELEQQVFDLRRELADRDGDLAAARAVNRDPVAPGQPLTATPGSHHRSLRRRSR